MSEEMTIGNGVDLAVMLTPGDKKIFDMVDEIVEQSIVQGDIQPAMSLGKSLRRSIQANGLALAKLLYRVREAWEVLGDDNDLYEIIYAEMGVASSTVHKYINMWDAIFANPNISDEIKSQLEGKPIKALLLLTAAAREGEISKEDWERVSDATTSSEVRSIVRDLRGERTSSNQAIVLELNMTSGILMARKGDQYDVVGMLNVGLRQESNLIEASITRIVNSANIMER
jgi:hypothetical protein